MDGKLEPTNLRHGTQKMIAAALLFGIAAMIPAWPWGLPFGADLDNHFRFVQPFYDEIAKGNWLPGWLVESNNGFGDARWLVVTSVAICPVVADAVKIWTSRIKQRRIRPLHLPLVLLFAATAIYIVPEIVVDTTYMSRQDFTVRLAEIRDARSFNYWLPQGAIAILMLFFGRRRLPDAENSG